MGRHLLPNINVIVPSFLKAPDKRHRWPRDTEDCGKTVKEAWTRRKYAFIGGYKLQRVQYVAGGGIGWACLW